MLSILRERFKQGYNTSAYPLKEPLLPERFKGLPRIHGLCAQPCQKSCLSVCPTQAITFHEMRIHIDLGKCIFCNHCADACPEHRIEFTHEYRLASSHAHHLVLSPEVEEVGFALNQTIQKRFGKSLQLRLVSAGGCNACEADLNVLGTPTYDLARFGITFTASPRHADGIIVTGPVSMNMKDAILDTYHAIASPKLVIASGTCAISGGIFKGNDEVLGGIGDLLSIDLLIPGCPPHPYTALHALLKLIGRV